MSILEELRETEGQLVRHIETLKRRIVVLQSNVTNMRAVLAFHQPGIAPEDFLPNMTVRRLLGRGETKGYCLQALRAAPGGLDTRELARFVMLRKGLDDEDVVLVKKIVMSVASVMTMAHRRRLVRSDGKRNGIRLWRIEDQPKKPRTGRN